MKPINRFLVGNGLLIAGNPCISPDFCLDWPRLRGRLLGHAGSVTGHPKSRFETADGAWTLVEDEATGDCAWSLRRAPTAPAESPLADAAESGGETYYPATWENLLRMK